MRSHSPQYCTGRIYRNVFEDDIEQVERYHLGALNPVKLADEFAQGRYCVIHKLGYGSNCTVWLARDRLASKNVSLKIHAAWASECSSETEILVKIHENAPRQAGCKFIRPLLLDSWT